MDERDEVHFFVNLRKVTALLHSKSFEVASNLCEQIGERFQSLANESSKFWCLRGGGFLGCRRFEKALFCCNKSVDIDEVRE